MLQKQQTKVNANSLGLGTSTRGQEGVQRSGTMSSDSFGKKTINTIGKVLVQFCRNEQSIIDYFILQKQKFKEIFNRCQGKTRARDQQRPSPSNLKKQINNTRLENTAKTIVGVTIKSYKLKEHEYQEKFKGTIIEEQQKALSKVVRKLQS